MTGSGVRLLVLDNDLLVAIGISLDGSVHRGKLETGGGSGARQMIALVPALDAAVPQYPTDGVGECKRTAFELRGGAEPRQAVNVRLVLRDIERGHVLQNRIGTRKAERNVLVFGDAARVEHDVTGKLRIGALEK